MEPAKQELCVILTFMNITNTKFDEQKNQICLAAKELLAHTTVEKLTVKQITEQAHISRQTFYRTFLDKYDLINWYFDQLMVRSFEEMGEGKTVLEALTLKFRYLKEEQVFFRAAFLSDAQNNLKDHDFEMIYHFYLSRIVAAYGTNPSEELTLLLELYCNASIDMTAKWIIGGCEHSPEWLAKLLVNAIPVKLAAVFKNMGFLDD